MRLIEFFDMVENCAELDGACIGHGEFVVSHVDTGITTVLKPDAIVGTDWFTLYEIMTERREPQVLTHFSRVVGYYSMIENWNESKLGELRDRQKGNYEF